MGRWREQAFSQLEAEELERRLGLFRRLLWVQVGGILLLMLTVLIDGRRALLYMSIGLALGAATLLLSFVGYWLARKGRFNLGTYLFVIGPLLAVGYFIAFYGTLGAVPALYVWPVMVVAILLEPAHSFGVAAFTSLALVGLTLAEVYQALPLPLLNPAMYDYWHRPSDRVVLLGALTGAVDLVLVYNATAYLLWMASRSLLQAVRRSREQAAELQGFQERLEQSVAEQSRAMADLQSSLEVIREMGNPVLPIFQGVILVPLIGAMDSARADQTMDAILHGVTRHRARAVILDITGIPAVDSSVANALVQTARGVRLLGATPILVGVRAEVAQTIVELGVDLTGIATQASLQEGLEYALREMGARIVVEDRGDLVAGHLVASREPK